MQVTLEITQMEDWQTTTYGQVHPDTLFMPKELRIVFTFVHSWKTPKKSSILLHGKII